MAGRKSNAYKRVIERDDEARMKILRNLVIAAIVSILLAIIAI